MTSRRARLYPTPDEAESAFYDAFERADPAAMMTVWAERDDVVCVHPSGPRLVGYEAVRESWMRILSGNSRFRMHATEVRRFDGNSVAVHSVVEVLSAAGREGPTQSVFATNVYELTDGGWRMVVHQASAAPEPEPAPADDPAPTPHTLH